jgi:hypothetical protein
MTFPLSEDGSIMTSTHSRIDFTHRGILAFTSTPSSPTPFGEFMVTTAEAGFLDKDGYNIIGVIQGNTLFNATRILDKVLAGDDEYVSSDVDDEDGRSVKVTGVFDEVGMEPVDEVVRPVWMEVKREVKKKKKRKAVNDAAVLSFGGDDDDEEGGDEDWKGRMKKGKKKKKKAKEENDQERTKADAKVEVPTPAAAPPANAEASKKSKKTLERPAVEPPAAQTPAVAADDSDSDSVEEMSMVDKMRAKYTKNKGKTTKKKKDKEREVMAIMESFKESVKKVKQKNTGTPKGTASYFGQVLEKGEEDSEEEGDWREGRFECKKHIDHKTKMAN